MKHKCMTMAIALMAMVFGSHANGAIVSTPKSLEAPLRATAEFIELFNSECCCGGYFGLDNQSEIESDPTGFGTG